MKTAILALALLVLPAVASAETSAQAAVRAACASMEPLVVAGDKTVDHVRDLPLDERASKADAVRQLGLAMGNLAVECSGLPAVHGIATRAAALSGRALTLANQIEMEAIPGLAEATP